jgi:DNA-binding transcriptional LysR family regulator
VSEIETIEDQISGQRDTPHGLLRVTTSLAFSTHQLAPVILEFMARHPLVQLELLPTDRVIDMVEEGVDVAIRIGRLADTSFMARKIGEDKRLICRTPPACHGTPRRPEDLARHNCIVSRERAYLNAGSSAWMGCAGERSARSGRGPGRHQRARCRCSSLCRASASCA